MTWDWHWIGSFKGTPFIGGDFRYNSGDPYKSYRFGPLLIRVFMRGANIRIDWCGKQVETNRLIP